MNNFDQRKRLSIACHRAIFFSSTIVSIGVPIVILLVSDDPVVKENAKESINVHINLYLYTIILVLMIILVLVIIFVLSHASSSPDSTFGYALYAFSTLLILSVFPLFILLAIASFLWPFLAILCITRNPQKPYRYPFLWRLL